MIRTLIIAGVSTLALASAAVAQPMDAGPGRGMGPMQGPGMHGPRMGDSMTMDFITKAGQSDLFEIKEGRLAAQRSHNPHVRQFATTMVSAHTKTTMGLKRAIRQAGMAPPPAPILPDDLMHMISDLRGLHGPDFDRAYIDQQVHAHAQALKLMQNYAQNGPPGPIRDAAQQTTAIVQQHLDMAKDIQSHIER
jgi:putative membrane protein